ncbi:MAG TPA: hypothetical protein VGL91_06025 [Acidobacteriota bacterium]
MEDRPNPPLTAGFFHLNFLDKLYPGGTAKQIEHDYPSLFGYIKPTWELQDVPFGTSRWESLNLEDVFTSLAIENEFLPKESDIRARRQLALNELTRYIQRIIGLCTFRRSGKFSKLLVEKVKLNDSIITFNYDLLLDRELFKKRSELYQTFHVRITGQSLFPGDSPWYGPGTFLKMHGSLNWYVCTNELCGGGADLTVVGAGRNGFDERNFERCLVNVSGIGDLPRCFTCGSPSAVFLIPPLLNKPIMKNSITRAIWGQAFAHLASASNVVILGFSFAPTDFYAQWLFRSALRNNPDGKVSAKVWIINPGNDPSHSGHGDFKRRMQTIFGSHYEDKYRRFEEVEEILEILYADKGA